MGWLTSSAATSFMAIVGGVGSIWCCVYLLRRIAHCMGPHEPGIRWDYQTTGTCNRHTLLLGPLLRRLTELHALKRPEGRAAAVQVLVWDPHAERALSDLLDALELTFDYQLYDATYRNLLYELRQVAGDYSCNDTVAQDSRLKNFSRLMLRKEVLRLRRAIRKHKDYRGNDRCHIDDGELYAVLPETPPSPEDLALPPLCEWLPECIKFHQTRQPDPDREEADSPIPKTLPAS